MPNSAEEDRLTIAQAAKLLGCSRRTIYNHSDGGLLKIDHDHKGKPYITRASCDLVLRKKGDLVKKGQFVPEGTLVVSEDRYNAAMLRLQQLEAQMPKLIEYQEQVEAKDARITELESEVERVKSRGLIARILNR